MWEKEDIWVPLFENTMKYNEISTYAHLDDLITGMARMDNKKNGWNFDDATWIDFFSPLYLIYVTISFIYRRSKYFTLIHKQSKYSQEKQQYTSRHSLTIKFQHWNSDEY